MFLVVINGRLESEAMTETQARQMAEDAALNGASAKVAKVVAECAPFPQPNWTEVT